MACAGVLASSTASAGPPPEEHVARFSLTLVGEDNPIAKCGGGKALEGAIEQRLHRSIFTDADVADSTLVVRAEANDRGDQWRAHISELARDSQELGQRDVTVRADDCAKGIDTLSVVLAIMVGPPRTVPGTTEPSAPAPTPAPAPEPSPPIPQTSVQPARAREPSQTPASAQSRPAWHLSPLLDFTAGTGVLPGLSWALQGGVVVEPPTHAVYFIGRGAYWPARSVNTQPGGDFDRLSVALLACHEFIPRKPASFALCTGLDGGRLHADAPNLTAGTDVSRLLLDIPLEGRVGFHLGKLGKLDLEPFVAAQIAANLRRDRFLYRDPSGEQLTLLRPSLISAQGSIGLVVHFL